MSNNEFYATDVTDEEAELGFQLALISNPRRAYVGNASLIRAVIYVVGPMDQIVKTRDPDGDIQYSHRQYEDLRLGDEPDWNPVLVPFPSPSDAIRLARKKVDETVARQSGLIIDPALPSMLLHCPDCDQQFTKTKDYLGISEDVVCPDCGKANAASNMIRIETF